MMIIDIYSAVLIRCVSVIRAARKSCERRCGVYPFHQHNTTNELMLNVTIVLHQITIVMIVCGYMCYISSRNFQLISDHSNKLSTELDHAHPL